MASAWGQGVPMGRSPFPMYLYSCPMASRPLPSQAPELGALDLFASVIRLGSLSKAAAAHHISQPSASARIRTLERLLGLNLLERTPAGSLPTTAGVLVAQWSADVLE